MVDIQYGIIIMGEREVPRPYRVWFFVEGELFFMFLFQSPQYLSTEPKNPTESAHRLCRLGSEGGCHGS